MGLERVVDEVRSEGKKRAAEIRARTKTDSEAILAEARHRATGLRADRAAKARGEAERILRQEVSNAELEVRRRRLLLEKELLDRAIGLTRQRLGQLPKDEQDRTLRSLVAAAGTSSVKIICRKQDEPTIRIISRVPLSGNHDRAGGIIVESADGTFRLDLTYDTILDEIRDEGLRRVAAVLFPEAAGKAGGA